MSTRRTSVRHLGVGIAATVALGWATAGCGSAAPAISVPSTTSTTMPTSATVPPLGLTPSVLPATAANATANAEGACSRFALLYIRLPQQVVGTALAEQYLAPVQQFADAAATGNPTQWDQLRADVAALVGFVGSGAWAASTSQSNLGPVQTVNTDCAPFD